jgi:3-hydroxymyristoyl/3-hydroxydecanoyl-(acyl carrier protein) dehydratase
MSKRERTACVAPDHPSLAGHFLGDPLVPGVVILQHVQAALEAELHGCRLTGFTRVKFLRPLRPGQPFVVSLERRSVDRAVFVCHSQGEPIARGQLLIADAAGARPV